MRVVIEIPDDKAGTGRYVRELAAHLERLAATSTGEPLEIIRASYRRFPHTRYGPRIARLVNSFRMVWWMQVSLPRVCRKSRADVLHCTAFICPFFPPCPVVLTVHDMTHARYPETMDPLWRWYKKIFFKASLRRASRLIAVSRFSASELAEIHPEHKAKIEVVYEAAAERFFSPEPRENETAERIAKLGIEPPYFLHVGTANPRKNLSRLLKGFDLFKKKFNRPHRMVCVGARGWLCDEMEKLAETLSAKRDLIFTGRIAEEDLLALYRGAEALVMPSLYEGFGLPVLEAMASKCPVITSNVSSLPEIAGDAALLVDPLNETEIAEAMEHIAGIPALRKEMIEKGLKQVARFSWERSARETAEIYATARDIGKKGRHNTKETS